MIVCDNRRCFKNPKYFVVFNKGKRKYLCEKHFELLMAGRDQENVVMIFILIERRENNGK